MSLNATPRGDRIHIALFGKRNAGKSSVINAMTNQELADRIRCQRNNDRSCIQGNGTSAIRTSSYDRYPGT